MTAPTRTPPTWNSSPETQGLGNLSRMIEWHFPATPGEFELRRHQFIHTGSQRNRAPSIDHPEYAWSVFVDQRNDSRLYVGSTPTGDGGLVGNDADGLITTTLSVLDHAAASFLAGGTSSSRSLNFGTLPHGDRGGILTFEMFDLAGGLGNLRAATLDRDSIVENCPDGAFSSNVAAFSGLPAGSSRSATVSMSTVAPGMRRRLAGSPATRRRECRRFGRDRDRGCRRT